MKSEVEILTERVAFLERIWRQACLTHGGRVEINPALYPEAESSEWQLMFGSFLDEPGTRSGAYLITRQQAREWTRG